MGLFDDVSANGKGGGEYFRQQMNNLENYRTLIP